MAFLKVKSTPQIYLSEIAQNYIYQMTNCIKTCINNANLSEWSKKAAISSVKMLLYSFIQQIKLSPDNPNKKYDKKYSFRNEEI